MDLDPLGLGLIDEFLERIEVTRDIGCPWFEIGGGGEIIGVPAEPHLCINRVVIVIFCQVHQISNFRGGLDTGMPGVHPKPA